MARRFFFLAGLCSIALAAACVERQPPPRRASGADVLLRAEAVIVEARVPSRATLDSILRQHELSRDAVDVAVAAAKRVFNPRDLRAERPYRLVRSLDGLLREFEYQIDADRFLRIINPDRARPAVLDAKVLPYEKQIEVTAIRGEITAQHSSLIAAMDGTGEKIHLALSLAEIFGGSIDFNNDLQRGDSFEVLFEKSTRDGEFAGYGAILGARFASGGRVHQAFRWTNPDTGRPAYYDADGRSLRRQLLSSPLRFEPRITSGFSRRRFHPVHHEYRAHLGVDYGAPTGSAVVAVADGVVVSAGWAGGGGNTVRIRHAGGIETYYLHLSAFGKGIHAGAHVSQNQVIGRVGATGTATGPHLDYRLKRNGVFVNPVTVHRQQPPGEPIPASYLNAFADSRDGALQRLATVQHGSTRAALQATVQHGSTRVSKPDAVKAGHGSTRSSTDR